MRWLLTGLAAVILWVFLSSDASAATTLSKEEAKNLFPSQVNQWLDPVRRAAADHGIDPRVLLSIIEQESSGEDMGFHPDGTSYGLTGLTDMALSDLGISRDLTSLTPEEQISITAEFLALLKKREGSLFEALKWYNSGVDGGGSYAREVLNRASKSSAVPSQTAQAQTTSGTGGTAPAAAPETTGCSQYPFCDEGGGDGAAAETDPVEPAVMPVSTTEEETDPMASYRDDADTESQEEKLDEAVASDDALVEVEGSTLRATTGGVPLV